MNVKAILAAKKLGGDIFSIDPAATLATAAKFLTEHRIGCSVRACYRKLNPITSKVSRSRVGVPGRRR